MNLQATIKKPNGDRVLGQRGSDNKILIIAVRFMAFIIVAMVGWFCSELWANQAEFRSEITVIKEQMGRVEERIERVDQGVQSNGKLLEKLLDIQLNNRNEA